jgi:NAD-dependent deacetylase
MLTEKQKLREVVRLIESSKNIAILTGAGISVASGIRPFKGKEGLYTKNPEIKKLFTRSGFLENPEKFYEVCKSLYAVKSPNPTHDLLFFLQEYCGKEGKKIDIVTQNIDGLDKKAGSRVTELHGSIHRDHICTKSGCDEAMAYTDVAARVSEDDFDITCPKCKNPLRPNVVFYKEEGEEKESCWADIPEEGQAWETFGEAGLVIVMGSSLSANPAADIIDNLVSRQKLVVVNRDKVEFDGSANVVLRDLKSLHDFMIPKFGPPNFDPCEAETDVEDGPDVVEPKPKKKSRKSQQPKKSPFSRVFFRIKSVETRGKDKGKIKYAYAHRLGKYGSGGLHSTLRRAVKGRVEKGDYSKIVLSHDSNHGLLLIEGGYDVFLKARNNYLAEKASKLQILTSVPQQSFEFDESKIPAAMRKVFKCGAYRESGDNTNIEIDFADSQQLTDKSYEIAKKIREVGLTEDSLLADLDGNKLIISKECILRLAAFQKQRAESQVVACRKRGFFAAAGIERVREGSADRKRRRVSAVVR